MKAVDQTKTLDGGQRGNCLAACLASIFEVEISEVPPLEELAPGEWKVAMAVWAEANGKRLIKKQPGDYAPGVHYIAVGLSDRGNRHATVALDGSIVHDPHADRMGLETFEYIFAPEVIS